MKWARKIKLVSQVHVNIFSVTYLEEILSGIAEFTCIDNLKINW